MNFDYYQKEKQSEISFLDVGGFFSKNFGGTYKSKSVCICTGHLSLSEYGFIPTFEFYSTPYLSSKSVHIPIYRISLGEKRKW